MMAVFFVVAALVLIWGWVPAGVIGLALIVRAFRAGKGYWWAAGLLVLAVVWSYMSLPYTFGIRSHKIRSTDGRVEACLMQRGTSTNVRLCRDGEERLVPLMAGFHRPERIFWMYDEKAIGVDYADDDPADDHPVPDKIIHVDLYFKAEPNVTKEDFDKMRFKTPMTADERIAFEEARQATLGDP